MREFRLITIEKAPFCESLDSALPTWAIHRGYHLTWYNEILTREPEAVLYKDQEDVGRWNYAPSLMEVEGKIKELEALERGVPGG